MSKVVLLDTGPLGLVTNPKISSEGTACGRWLQAALAAGHRVIVPEIADYEVRRELIRANKANGLRRLDALIAVVEYLPITTAAMREAAEYWASARQQGQPTASDQSLDADVILAAQAATLREPNAVIATTNVGHLSRFTTASLWRDVEVL